MDIPQLRGVKWLEPGEAVTREELEAAEKAENVRLGEGDVFVFRTGHHRRRLELGSWNNGYDGQGKAGLDPRAILLARCRRRRSWVAAGADGAQHWGARDCDGFDRGKGQVGASGGSRRSYPLYQVDFEAETKRLTAGKGVDVVYDSVGKTTFEKGLNLLRPRGMMVLYGASSGPVAPLDPLALTQKGSMFLTRPSLGHYIITAEELQERAGAVFGMIRDGKLKLRIEHLYPLAAAPQAHRDLEGRKTTGKLLLLP